MIRAYLPLLVILAIAGNSSCYCTTDKTHSFGLCEFRIHCIGNIRGVRLPDQCRESANYPVIVDVTLTDAIERFDKNLDIHFLNTLTSLKISGRWAQTILAILLYTTKLQNLNLVNIGIEKIPGTPFKHLLHLESINLSHNKLSDISELFQFHFHQNKLKRLFLSYNRIENIPGDTFEELTSLVELDLSHNLISDLTEEPFSELHQLQRLRLDNNRIKDLNGAVNGLEQLKHLYLRGNQIRNIDEESLKIIKHLETFDVSMNELEEIKPIMLSRHWKHFGNHSVCKILLSKNYITNVPNATSTEILSRYVRDLDIHSIGILTELDLSANSISNIEYNAFQSLIRMTSLNLSRNKLFSFLVNPIDLVYVEYLNLSSNYISHLYYESFSSMTNLQNLDLSYNHLDFIPDMTFNNNYNLQLVNMTYNDIEKLDSIRITMFHPLGGVLDLSNNGLFKLNIPLGEGLRLFTLMLRSNNISDTSLINLSHQTDLKKLDMSNNLILELDASSLRLPVTLVTLDLSCNRIHDIGPSTFDKFINLMTLRLGHNQLTQIEYGAFQGLVSLSNLDLSYNRMEYLDSKFLMDLKKLRTLSVRSNDMNVLDLKSWYGHKFHLQVYIDNNNLTCEWLGNALSDFNNGYSNVQPTVLVKSKAHHSLEGIPCEAGESESIVDRSQYVMVDERLLATSQKILEAVRVQNNYFRRIVKRVLHEDPDKLEKD